jgi:hypothetical protein
MYVFLGLNGIEIAATEEESPQDVMPAPLCEKFSRLLRQLQRDVEIAQITQLFPEASARRYYRLTLQDGATLVGVHEDPASARVNMPNVIAVLSCLRWRRSAADLCIGHGLRRDAAARPW